MKILILSDITAPYRIEVFRGLSKAFETTLFFNSARNDSRNPDWYKKPDEEFTFEILDNDKAKAHYAECVKRITNYDLVLCYDPWAKRSRALERLCMRKKIPYILNADGALGITTSFPKKQVKTFYVKRAALCFAGCERAVEYFKTYGAKDSKIVKHPFTSLKRGQILPKPLTAEQKREIKLSLGMEDRTTFISVGQFIRRKAFDLLLDAWGRTSQTAALYIIGGGPLEEEYLRTIKEKQLSNVHIVGFKKPEALVEYYLASDVYLMPTREDIWGLVVNEAMAAALPVITSNRCTAGNELVENDANGYVYPCEDTEALAGYIDKLSADESLRLAFSQKALEKISNYVLENIIESHIQEIKGLFRE